MQEDDLQRLFRERRLLRIGPEMSLYIQRMLHSEAAGAIPVIGADARTGVAQRQSVDLAELREAVGTHCPMQAPRFS